MLNVSVSVSIQTLYLLKMSSCYMSLVSTCFYYWDEMKVSRASFVKQERCIPVCVWNKLFLM